VEPDRTQLRDWADGVGQHASGGNRPWNTNEGHSNYNAAFVTLRKTASHGLTFDLNYTFAHSLDNLGLTQENTCAVTDAFLSTGHMRHRCSTAGIPSTCSSLMTCRSVRGSVGPVAHSLTRC